jgi:hypothetical protein
MKSNIGLAIKVYVWLFIYCAIVHTFGFAFLAFVLGIILACVPLFTSKILMIPAMCVVGYSFFFGDRAFAEWTLAFMPFIYIAAADTVMKMFD